MCSILREICTLSPRVDDMMGLICAKVQIVINYT
jgi:hypothetical protein